VILGIGRWVLFDLLGKHDSYRWDVDETVFLTMINEAKDSFSLQLCSRLKNLRVRCKKNKNDVVYEH